MADTRVKIVDIQVNITSAAQALAQYGQAIDAAKEKQKQLKQELKDGNAYLAKRLEEKIETYYRFL